jgi:hypothetical protein
VEDNFSFPIPDGTYTMGGPGVAEWVPSITDGDRAEIEWLEQLLKKE